MIDLEVVFWIIFNGLLVISLILLCKWGGKID